jgi:hypothetical protein
MNTPPVKDDDMCRHVSTLAALIGVVVAGSLMPPVATADPDDDPCGLAVNLFCRFLPMAPELDGDVDLTKQLPPAPPTPTMPGEFQVPR